MIANQVKGTGFRGTLDYLLGKEDAIIIGGNMLGENPSELSKEFSASRTLRPKLTRAVYHVSLSLPYDDHLSTSKWQEAADKYVQKMGFNGSQYVIVQHNDTKHEHIHIVASRIRLDGSVVSDSQDYKRSEKVVRGLEKSFNLTPTVSSHEVARKAPTKGELHKVIREQKMSTKGLLQSVINDVTGDRPDAITFVKRLQSYGVEMIPNMAKAGHISGVSFVHEGEVMKGSDLGRGYTWARLCKEKINYGRQQNITLRNYCQTQQKSTFRDDTCRTSKTNRGLQNGVNSSNRQRVSTNSNQAREIQWKFQQRADSKDRQTNNKLGRINSKYTEIKGGSISALSSNEKANAGKEITHDLLHSELLINSSGQGDRFSFEVEKQKNKPKQRRKKKRMKKKGKQKSLSLDIGL